MINHLLAAASAAVLLAAPAIGNAQSQGQSGSQNQAQSKSQEKSQSQTQSQSTGSPAQMLGKKVRLKSGRDIGEVTDVVVVDGKVENVVVDAKDDKDIPVMISITRFGPPQGDTYVLSMTEAELKSAPKYEGKSGSQGGQGSSSSGASQPKSGGASR
jgi:sporulation protein YlmC with PRC-barrel domain